MSLTISGQRFDRLMNSCRNHKTITQFMYEFITSTVNSINSIELESLKTSKKKINIGVLCIYKIHEKLCKFVHVCNVYLYKCTKAEYEEECDKVASLLKTTSNSIKDLQTSVSKGLNLEVKYKDDSGEFHVIKKCKKQITLRGIENIICLSSKSLENIIQSLRDKRKADISKRLTDSVNEYFEKKFESDKEDIYNFIDSFYS